LNPHHIWELYATPISTQPEDGNRLEAGHYSEDSTPEFVEEISPENVGKNKVS
jgi:hypothetical protein